ncbi:MAG: FAM151 family protein, partial [Actinomycetia bacterium]|nr:FAM151 family protein [Actinomycetes bacterium]
MLDHVFTDAIGALRDALESAMLERQAFEERFQADVLLGDVTWETSYGLPGEGSPPRVQADLTLEWPTWAQTAYRTWYL